VTILWIFLDGYVENLSSHTGSAVCRVSLGSYICRKNARYDR
jgi:hypothetical protein